MKPITILNNGEIERDSKSWKVAISFVAEQLDVVDQSLWAIGDVAKRIKGIDINLRTTVDGFTPLQQFAIEVSNKTKRYKNWKSAYDRICHCRSLAMAVPKEARVEELPISHHEAAAKAGLPKEEIKLKVEEAKEKGWTLADLKEDLSPTEPSYELGANYYGDHILTAIGSFTHYSKDWLKLPNPSEIDTAKASALLTSMTIMVKKTMPPLAKILIEKGAEVDPIIIDLTKNLDEDQR